MFELADNKKIGTYLKRAIHKKDYKSVRQFGKAYLEERNLPTNAENLRNMSNRLSQILNGKKGIQIDDLPVFTKLLDMSCEEILSAGKCFTPSSNHLTNYSIATSKNKKEWVAYVNREDKLILNADEYGKTVIDYALEFANFDFMKFLMDNGYIWFVGTEEKDLFEYGFGAGTSIERNPLIPRNMNVLDVKMQERYDLRMKMIILAIKHGDIQMLTELRAREIPSLYQANCYACRPAACDKYFDEELITALVSASDEILEYFSKEFEITDRIGISNRFMFPFISKLIDALIESGNDYVQWMLKDAIEHNRYALSKLTELLATTVNYYEQIYIDGISYERIKNDIIKSIKKNIDYYDDGDLVSYRTANAKGGIITNIVRVSLTSSNVIYKHLIKELNELYDQIQNITPII